LEPWFVWNANSRNVYAIIRGKHSTITYSYGNGDADAVYDVYYNERIPAPSGTPYWNGYIFKGFFTEENGGGTQVLGDSMDLISYYWKGLSDVTYYAHWEPRAYVVTLGDMTKESVTVYFDLNGGESGAPATREIGVGDSLDYPSEIPVRDGYAFICWSTDPQFGIYDFSSPLNKNLTLYARWDGSAYKKILPGENTVRISAIANTFRMYCIVSGDITIEVEQNAHIVCGETEGDGSITVSNCKAGSSYYVYVSSAEYSGDVTLTVTQGTPADGGTIVPGTTTPVTATVTFGSDDFSLAVPTSEGKTFVGWFRNYKQYTDENGDAICAWDYAANATLSAHWAED